MKRKRRIKALLATVLQAAVCSLIVASSSAQVGESPRSSWLLEVDNSYSVRQWELNWGLRRHFVHPMKEEEGKGQPQRPNQWVLLWEEDGEDALYFRFFFIPRGVYGPLTPKQLEKTEKVLIREFSMRLGDAVYLTELRDLGYEPMSLRLVPPDQGVLPPPVSIETPSLELISVQTQPNRVELTVVNRSSKGVLKLHSNACRDVYGMPGQPLLSAAGESVLKCGLRLDSDRRVHPSRIVVSSLLFDDFTYEGDADALRPALAYYAGVHLSLPAMIAILRARLDQPRDEERDGDMVKVLDELLEELFSVETPIPQGLAQEFALLADEPEQTDRWRESLQRATKFPPRSFAREMHWTTQRIIDTEAPHERFWTALERRLERYSSWLESFESNPPGPLF